jgi:hypothetical protein
MMKKSHNYTNVLNLRVEREKKIKNFAKNHKKKEEEKIQTFFEDKAKEAIK